MCNNVHVPKTKHRHQQTPCSQIFFCDKINHTLLTYIRQCLCIDGKKRTQHIVILENAIVSRIAVVSLNNINVLPEIKVSVDFSSLQGSPPLIFPRTHTQTHTHVAAGKWHIKEKASSLPGLHSTPLSASEVRQLHTAATAVAREEEGW